MEAEIRPRPDDAEREAILIALAAAERDAAEGRSRWAEAAALEAISGADEPPDPR